ncbi:MAG: DUF262 domain-containing protein [Candidatus Omnitrophica bacterium]|nr:DUF262 domain-containing protein [Candidatus Omnitrophota bacterium]MDD5351815.1 DUF262 domain-containing protein [Candidatus Omnitrophota bacterium]MDD5550641.1 DUF262 domain-containing protein [Candidatus Omnitrophota bacterium]
MSEINSYPMKNSAILRIGYERKLIDTNPDYQRKGDVWDLEKRQLLIDSILNEYDIPKMYFHVLSRPRKLPDGREVVYAIIDGKQRIETIWQFLDNKFSLSDDFIYFKNPKLKVAGLNYSDLAKQFPSLKVIFDSSVLPIIGVETDDIELIEDMFSRLNEAVPLNAAEKRNAMGGQMVRMINEVASHTFFTKEVKFSDNRYQHREVAARLLFLEDCILRHKKIIDTKKLYLDAFVQEYKYNADLNANDLGNRVKNVLNEMRNIFNEDDVLLSTQSVPTIYYLLFRSALIQGSLGSISRKKLVNFKERVANNRQIAEEDLKKADFELLEFDRMSQQGTNDASSIRERLRIISNFFDIRNIDI